MRIVKIEKFENNLDGFLLLTREDGQENLVSEILYQNSKVDEISKKIIMDGFKPAKDKKYLKLVETNDR